MIHRLAFRQGEKAFVVDVANRLMIAGLPVLAVAMTSASALVTHYLFGPATTVITTAVVVTAFTTIWFALPLRRRCARHRLGR